MGKHIHKYKLKNLSRDKTKPPYWVYMCLAQECTHRIDCELTEGKLSICNRCGNPFEMKRAKLFSPNTKWIVYPHCDACTKTRTGSKSEKKEAIKKKLDEVNIDALLEEIIPKGL